MAVLKTIVRSVAAFIIILTGVQPLLAQHPNLARGFSPTAAYNIGDIDSVNLMNGGVTVRIPLGQEYHVGGKLSYRLQAVFNSQAFDYTTVAFQGPPRDSGYAKPYYNSNAGNGWIVSLGGFSICYPGQACYITPDGAEHRLYGTLHDGEPVYSCNTAPCPIPGVHGLSYTRDGSYMRFRGVDAMNGMPSGTEVEFPDGTVQLIAHDDMWMYDRELNGQGLHQNFVHVTYLTSHPDCSVAGTDKAWQLQDSLGRQEVVCFSKHHIDLENYPGIDDYDTDMVNEVVVPTFGGDKARYKFTIQDAIPNSSYQGIRVNLCVDTYPAQPFYTSLVPAPLLTQILLPDGSSYEPTYHMGEISICNGNGLLKNLKLPTGGFIAWKYDAYHIPGSNSPSCPEYNSQLNVVPGVVERRFLAPDGTELGKWTYGSSPYGSDGGGDFPCPNGENPERQIPQPESTIETIVTNPHGDQEHHYFSTWPLELPSPGGITYLEYGLPYSKLDTRDGMYLSSQLFEFDSATGTVSTTPSRQTYVLFDRDAGINEFDANRRMRKSRTYFQDGTYTDDNNSEFDGLGHYRKNESGTSSVSRTTYRAFNLRDPNVNPNQGVDSGQYGDGGTFQQVPGDVVWFLGGISKAIVTVGNKSVRTDTCFDDYAHLVRSRTYADNSSTTPVRSPADFVTTLRYGFGDPIESRWYGGNRQPLNTDQPLCSMTLPDHPAYSQTSTYESGQLKTMKWDVDSANADPEKRRSVMNYVVNRTIDAMTGLVTSSRDVTGLETTYTYDKFGRPLTATPPGGPVTSYTYSPSYGYGASASSPAVTIETPSASGPTKSKIVFDGFGRVWRNLKLMHDDTWSIRQTHYDGMGNIDSQSFEETAPSSLTNTFEPQAKVLTTFDGHGRPLRITQPDGTYATLVYTDGASSQVKRTISIGSGGTGSTVTPVDAVFKQNRDALGRLTSVVEKSGRDASNQPADVTTSYAYDPADHLTSVTTSGQTQLRTFTYDGRGMLTSETHPENGTTTYSDFDARGHAGRRQLATADDKFDLIYKFDAAERLVSVAEHRGAQKPLQSFVFDFVEPEDAAHAYTADGRLVKAVRWNYDTANLGGDRSVTTYVQYDASGRPASKRTAISDSGEFQQTFQYNDGGQPKELHFPTCVAGCGGEVKADRVTSLVWKNGFLRQIGDFTSSIRPIDYWPNGSVKELTHVAPGDLHPVTDSQTLDHGMPRPASISVSGFCVGPPINGAEPADKTIVTGKTATLSVTPPAGVATPTYAWYQVANNVSTPLPNGNAAQVTTPVLTADSYFYVLVGDGTCTTQSRTAKVTVRTCDTINIATQPQSVRVAPNATATFTVAASESGAHYEWYEGKSGDTTTRVGTDSATLTVTATAATSYWVRVFSADRLCSIDSSTAYLTLCLNVFITGQPADAARVFDTATTTTLTAHVEVAGSSLFHYVWHAIVDGGDTIIADHDGRTNATDDLSWSVPKIGTFTCWVVITDGCGTTARSSNFTLTAYDPSCTNWSILGVTETLVQLPRGGMGWPISAVTDPADDGNSGYSYEWYNSKGVKVGTTRTITMTAYTWDWVYVKVSRSCGTAPAPVTTTTRVSDKAYFYVYGSCPIAPVTVSPTKATIVRGGSATFKAVTEWPKLVHYQWYRGVSGDTSSPQPSVQGHPDELQVDYHPYPYWVRVSNDCGLTEDSPTATLEIVDGTYSCYPVLISQPPHDLDAASGQTVALTCDATSETRPITYGWYQGTDNTHPLGTSTTGQFNVTPTETTTYFVTVTNGCATSKSDYAVVHVVSCGSNTITTQPQDSPTDNFHPVTLSVAVSNPSDIASYTWYEGESGDTSKPAGSSSTTLTTPVLDSTKKYWVRMTTTSGCKFDSRTALVDVCVIPVITSPPLGINVQRNQGTWVSVGAFGTDLHYQWYLGVSGDTSRPLLHETHAASWVNVSETTSFWCDVWNRCAHTPSPTITLSVCPGINGDPVATNPIVMPGTTTTLTANAAGATTLQWYQGEPGDTSHPFGGNSATVTTPPITADTKFYLRAISGTCNTDSNAVEVHLCTEPVTNWTTPAHPIHQGDGFTLTVSSVPTAELTTFYQGNPGDTSHPVDSPNPWTTVYPTQTTTYWARAKLGNCWADTTAMTIEVCVPTITQQPADVTLMPNQASVPLSVTATLGATYQWYTGDKGDLHNAVANGNTATINVAPTADTRYWCRVTGSCSAYVDSETALVKVCKPPVITGQPYDAYVMRGYYATVSVGATGSDLAYQWYAGVKGDTTNPIATQAGRSAMLQNLLLNNTTSYWVRVSGTCGSADSNTVTVHVCVPPSITTTPQSPSIFSGATATLHVDATEETGEPLHYHWFRGDAGDASTPVGTDAASYTTAALTTTTTYWVEISSNSCITDSEAIVVNVCIYPESLPAPADAQTAIGQTTRLSGYPAASGNLYMWFRGASGDTANPISGWTTTNYVDVAPTVTTQYWYKLQNGSCVSSSATGTVYVCVPTITQQPSGAMVNSGAPTTLTVVANTPGLTYQWYTGTSGTTSSPIAGATGASVTVAPTAGTSYWVRVTGSCGRFTDSNTATLTICQPPAITSVTQNAWVARGQTYPLGVAATGSSLTYQWYSGASGNTASPIAGGTGASITVAPQNTATYWVRVTGACGTIDSTTITISVCATPAITVQPQSVATFGGSSVTLSVTANSSTTAPISFQWYRGSTGDTATPVGTNASTYTTPALTSDTNYWVRVSCGPCTPADSNTATVSMCAYAQSIPSPGDQQTTVGQTVRLSGVPASAQNSYFWYRGASGDTSTPLTGWTSTNYIDVAPTVTTQYWYKLQNGSCISSSATATVYVCVPQITTQPQSVTINPGTSTTLSVAANTSGITYQWYTGTSGTTTSPVSGATNSTLTVTPASTTSYWVRVTGSCGRTTDSQTATVTICQLPSITSVTQNAWIARGQSYPLGVNATGTGLTYQWYTGTSGTTTSPITGATSASLSVSPQNTTDYWVKVSGTCGTANSTTITISVCVTPSITTQPQSVSIFSGSSTTLSVVASEATTSSVSYQWYRGLSSDVSTPVGTNSPSFTTPALTVDTNYWVRVSCGLCTPVDSQTATVAMCMYPQTVTSSGDVQTTVGQTTRLTTVSNTGSNSYNWYTGAAGDTSHPLYLGSTYNYIDVAPTVTTQYWAQVTNGSCVSRTNTITVSVCVPQMTTQPQSVTINPGASATLTAAANTAGVTYQWYTGTSGTTTSPVSGGTAASLTVTPAATTSYWVRATSSCGRTVDSSTVTVTICASATITRQPNDGTPIYPNYNAYTDVQATGSNLTYQWYAGETGVTTSPLSGKTGTSLTMVISNTMRVWVRVTGQCGTVDSRAVWLSVYPSIGTHPASTSVSSGSRATLTVYATGTLLHYKWMYTNGNLVTTCGDATTCTTPPVTAPIAVFCQVSSGIASVNSYGADITLCSGPGVTTGWGYAGGSCKYVSASISGDWTNVEWYKGETGDTSQLVGSGNYYINVCPTTATSYWPRVFGPDPGTGNPCSTDGPAVTIYP